TVLCQVANPHPLRIVRIGRVRELTAERLAPIVDDDEVMLDAAVGRAPDAIQHFDDGPDPHAEAGFFEHLARDGLLERLAELDAASRHAPVALQRLVSALDEQDAIAFEDHCADADNRAIWKRS